MDLKAVSADSMRSQTKQIAKEERETLTKMLHHLKEIERRRLFSAWKFKSLFDYAVNELSYSSDQADRRIAAMRLLKELPELEEKINSGAFTLTNLGMAKTLFKKEKYSTAKKAEFLKKIENKSVRDTARVIATISPQALSQDKIRPVSERKDEFQFLGDSSLMAKIEKLKGLLAHSHPGISLGELVDKLADLGLKEWDKTAALGFPSLTQHLTTSFGCVLLEAS